MSTRTPESVDFVRTIAMLIYKLAPTSLSVTITREELDGVQSRLGGLAVSLEQATDEHGNVIITLEGLHEQH